ncbi:MAG: hypothetical protein ACRD3C_22365 [Vicinamibacterales bacterium]
MDRDLRAFALALLFYGAFYCAFFYQSFLSGNYIAPSDSLDFGVAAYLSSPALWTQGMYSGYPIAADPQSLTWYPVLHLFRLAGLDWNVFLISAYVVASATCFLLVRRLTRSNLAGAFSGCAYGFSGVMLAHIGHFNQIHAAAWVPIALYGLQLVREGHHRTGTAVAAAGFALMWLAGHPQVPVYTAYLSAALVLGGLLIDRPQPRVVRARVGWSAAAIALGLGLAAIAVLPMVELGELSRRSESNWELYISKALPPWQLLGMAVPLAFGGFWHEGEIVVPYFGAGAPVEYAAYVGLLPLALALAAPFVLSHDRREARLWLAITIVAMLLCLGAVTPVGTLFFYVPGYASFRVPARHLFVVALCLSVASGLAFAELTRRRDAWSAVAAGIVATVVLAAVALVALAWRTPDLRALVSGNRRYAEWALIWPLVLSGLLIGSALLAKVTARGRAALLAFATLFVAFQVVDLAMLHYRMPGQRFAYADVVRAEAIPHPSVVALRNELRRSGERVLATDGSKNPFLLPNLTRPWDVPAASGSGSLGIERYLDVLGMGGPGDVYPETLSTAGHRGLDLFSIRYAFVPDGSPLAHQLHAQPTRWSPLENVHYYDNDPDTYYTVFRNARALPRAWCVPAVVHVTSPEALAAIRSGHLPNGAGEFDPTRAALVEPGDLARWDAAPAARGSDVLAEVDRRQYLVRSDGPCLLVLGEVHYPWWRASVDDADVDIVRVNHAMMGVPVPPGSHVVRLRLQPTSIWTGGTISAASVLLWAGLAVWAFRRRAPHSRRDAAIVL